MVVPLAFMLAALTYPICINFLPNYRIPADALGSSDIGTSGGGVADGKMESDEEAQVKTAERGQVVEVEKR